MVGRAEGAGVSGQGELEGVDSVEGEEGEAFAAEDEVVLLEGAADQVVGYGGAGWGSRRRECNWGAGSGGGRGGSQPVLGKSVLFRRFGNGGVQMAGCFGRER